jgi:peptide/nickel transport system ATP-binding protein
MSLVSHFSDRLMVMYAGQVAEFGPTREVFDTPRHPYSVGLLDAFPSIRGPRLRLTGIPGAPPDLARPPAGCRFAPRCPKVMDVCRVTPPELYPVGPVQVRCLLHSPDPDLRNGTPPPGSATGSVTSVAAGGGATGHAAREEGSADE